jgi:AraC family transcriptional regulator, ethanolamine operon transcriptional activator
MQTLRTNYNSMEEFSLAMNALGWEANFKQLDRGAGNNVINLCASENAVVMLLGFSSRNHHRAIPSAQTRTFGLLAGPQASGRIANRVLDSESLIHMDSYHGVDAVVEPSFSGYTMAFSEERLAKIAELYELPDPDFAASTPGSERFPGPHAVARLRSLLAGVLALAANGERAAATNLLELELPAAVLSNWMGTPESSPARRGNRALVVARALDYLNAFPQEAISVEQLCRVSACSISTLERAFRGHFGVSPKRYLAMSRLSGVRRTLLEGAQECSIGQTANDWGFWHMGQFARDYRQQFGELPSETLAFSCAESIATR